MRQFQYDPVSYTHLDVYKRQRYKYVLFKNKVNIFSPIPFILRSSFYLNINMQISLRPSDRQPAWRVIHSVCGVSTKSAASNYAIINDGQPRKRQLLLEPHWSINVAIKIEIRSVLDLRYLSALSEFLLCKMIIVYYSVRHC